MRICNLNTSSLQKKAVRMYNDHVESLIEAGDCKKNLQEKLSNITARGFFHGERATLPRFEQESLT